MCQAWSDFATATIILCGLVGWGVMKLLLAKADEIAARTRKICECDDGKDCNRQERN